MTSPSGIDYFESDVAAAEVLKIRRPHSRRMGPPPGYRLPGAPSVPYRIIPLSQGLFAYVSPDKYLMVVRIRWHAWWNENTQSFYAKTNVKKAGGGYHSYGMHNFVLGIPIGSDLQADHINPDDTLNNCTDFEGTKGNLRPATRKQQIKHRSKYKNNKTGLIGVWERKEQEDFRADLRVDGHLIHLGCFKDKVEGARIRDRAAIKYFGEFAYLNFPLADYEPGGVAYVEEELPDYLAQIKRNRRRMTSEDRQTIEHLLRTTDLFYTEIGKKLGFHRACVRRIAVAAGLDAVIIRNAMRGRGKAK